MEYSPTSRGGVGGLAAPLRGIAPSSVHVGGRAAYIFTESDSLASAAPRLLDVICDQLAWDCGELWMPNADETKLESAETWRHTTRSHPRFETAPHQLTFAPGEGLPGAVWEENEPKWLSDVREHDDFVRAQAATEADLRAGFDETDTAEGNGMGVRIMNYRAHIIGGTLDINSTLGEGTVVTCTLPRQTHASAAADDDPVASTHSLDP